MIRGKNWKSRLVLVAAVLLVTGYCGRPTAGSLVRKPADTLLPLNRIALGDLQLSPHWEYHRDRNSFEPEAFKILQNNWAQSRPAVERMIADALGAGSIDVVSVPTGKILTERRKFLLRKGFDPKAPAVWLREEQFDHGVVVQAAQRARAEYLLVPVVEMWPRSGSYFFADSNLYCPNEEWLVAYINYHVYDATGELVLNSFDYTGTESWVQLEMHSLIHLGVYVGSPCKVVAKRPEAVGQPFEALPYTHLRELRK